jgi:hypothetical protein
MKIVIKKSQVKEDMEVGTVQLATSDEMGGGDSYEKDPDGYEGKMAKTNLYKIADYAKDLCAMLRDDENLEPWVEEKIAVAASMIDSVAHHLKYEKRR